MHFELFQITTGARLPGAVTITLACQDYGSLRAAMLARLHAELQYFARTTSARVVILDVTLLKYVGAKFLSLILEFQARLRAGGVQLQLSGDVGGVLAAAGLSGLLTPPGPAPANPQSAQLRPLRRFCGARAKATERC